MQPQVILQNNIQQTTDSKHSLCLLNQSFLQVFQWNLWEQRSHTVPLTPHHLPPMQSFSSPFNTLHLLSPLAASTRAMHRSFAIAIPLMMRNASRGQRTRSHTNYREYVVLVQSHIGVWDSVVACFNYFWSTTMQDNNKDNIKVQSI